MPFTIIRNDITKVRADAIVNTANPEPVFAAGTDAAIYRAAGERKLLHERKKIGRIAAGEAAVTPAFRLKAKYIIHTVGPVWVDGEHRELELLASCYRKSLLLARQLGCRSIAFPLISTGVYGFPKDCALDIALGEFSSFLAAGDNSPEPEEEMKITLVVFDRKAFDLSSSFVQDVRQFVDENYVAARREEEYGRGFQGEDPYLDERRNISRERRRRISYRRETSGQPTEKRNSPNLDKRQKDSGVSGRGDYGNYGDYLKASTPYSDQLLDFRRKNIEKDTWQREDVFEEETSVSQADYPMAEDTASEPVQFSAAESSPAYSGREASSAPVHAQSAPGMYSRSLKDVIDQAGETFQESLLRMIDQRGLTDTQVYKRANMDRRLFSKIRSNPNYNPKRQTAISLGLALELNMDEMRDLLGKAGIALSPSSKFDLIISYCIQNRIYDIIRINAILFDYDQPLLGA